MAEDPRPLEHLARALEELLRAGAEALALWQEREQRAGALPLAAPDRSAEHWARQVAEWIGAGEGAMSSVREALGREIGRWELKAASDPAARRVRDLFVALLEVMGEERGEPRSRPRPGRAPRRPLAR